jgi:hypothetical protein
MACPYFYPVAPSRNGSAMLPLGDRWDGVCRAAPDAVRKPDDSILRLCNMGYARGQCPHFPACDGPDAVRFTVKGSVNGSVSLYFAIERDHHPFAHGPLTYLTASGTLADPPASEVLDRQARAYAEGYLWRWGRLEPARPPCDREAEHGGRAGEISK